MVGELATVLVSFPGEYCHVILLLSFCPVIPLEFLVPLSHAVQPQEVHHQF